MTLVLSEASKFGIVMVADSAITTTITKLNLPSGAKIPKHVRFGAEKIKRVPNKPIGISCWGMGRIGEIPIDLWLEDFLSAKISQDDDLDALCTKLADEVNETFFKDMQDDLGGFHIGAVLGYTTEQPMPVLYHIHREGEDGKPGKFQLHKEIPFGRMLSPETYKQNLRNGMIYYLADGLQSKFDNLHGAIINYLDDLGQKGVQVPYPPSLDSQERLNRLLVGAMCDIFAMSNGPASVARPLSSLTIALNGSVRYSSPLRDVRFP